MSGQLLSLGRKRSGGGGGGGGGGGTSISAQHWRVFIYDTGDPNWAEAAEVQFRTTAGSNDPPSGGTPFASSVYSGQPASSAFDSNSSTSWSSAANQESNSHIGYDFGSAKSVIQMAYMPPSNTAYAPRGLRVEYSTDGSTWLTALDVPGTGLAGTWTAGVFKTFDLP